MRYYWYTLISSHYNCNYHYIALQDTTLITAHHNCNCNCNYTTLITLHYNYSLQLQLHYTTNTTTSTPTTTSTTTPTTTTALRHTTSRLHPAVVVRHCNHCNHLSVHQWIRSAIRESQQPTSAIGFIFLKLPPPPCAVLLVYTIEFI